MPRALLSVYDKTDIVRFAATLSELGWSLVASDGTKKMLQDAGLDVTSLEQVTGMPERLGGKVKTLHPAIHCGILATDNPGDIAELASAGYAPINMVVCNLRSFREMAALGDISLQDALERMDVGGATLLRTAARNFFHVIVICETNDYARIGAALKAGGTIDLATRRDLAIKAFAHIRDYDTAIHAFLSQDRVSPLTTPDLPEQLSFGMQRIATLSSGENPHQTAAYYSRRAVKSPLGATVITGQELTYNHILDINAGWRAVSRFDRPTVVVIKQASPTGFASAEEISAACPKAIACDPIAASGGTLVANRPVDAAFVDSMGALLVEVIVAPSFTPGTAEILATQRKSCRLVEMPPTYNDMEMDIRSVYGGLLVQSADTGDPDRTSLKPVTRRPPTGKELEALQFAWKAVQHVRSNAVVLVAQDATVGIGGGLPNRADSARLALAKAGVRAQGAAIAFDSLLPSAEILDMVASAGVTAVIQPGGSIRDSEVIEAANTANIAMVFTGTRHLKHS